MRDMKKKRREELIVKKFKLLLKKKEFINISMNELASECDFAVGTLYNYFPSKNAILVSILNENIDKIILEGNEVNKLSYQTSSDAIIALIIVHFHFCKIESKDVLRLLADQLQNDRSDTVINKVIFGTLEKMKNQISQFLVTLDKDNKINDLVDLEVLSQIIFNLFYIHFREYIYTKKTFEESLENLINQIMVLATGFEK